MNGHSYYVNTCKQGRSGWNAVDNIKNSTWKGAASSAPTISILGRSKQRPYAVEYIFFGPAASSRFRAAWAAASRAMGTR
jgi:hypothetical protein